MNKFFATLAQERHSVRAYKPIPVEDEKMTYIMECVRLSPSAVNRQPWKFYLLSSPQARTGIQRCYDRPWFQQAPVYVLCCADHEASWHRPCDGKDHADIDVAIATEHLCLAAAECGLGTCWVCNFDAALCRELFRLPASFEPVAIVPVGYPAEETPKPRQRKTLDEIMERL